MKIHSIPSATLRLSVFAFLIFTAACVPEQRYVITDPQNMPNVEGRRDSPLGPGPGQISRAEHPGQAPAPTPDAGTGAPPLNNDDAPPYTDESQDNGTVALDSVPPSKTGQETLDSALGFCQASYDYWERGDLDNALDALDQAYALILGVDAGTDPELLQQREDLRVTIAKRIIEVYSSRFTVANGSHNAIPLVMNTHVERALTLLKGKERRFFLSAYTRSGRYRPGIVRELKEAGLPEELSWLPLIESGFKVRAMSRARALGLWQFIASTGYKYGLKRDTWVDERMDPDKSTKAAIAYLKELHQIFGDWATVLAAYNCGEGAVLRRIRTQKINYLDNFWDLYQKLPTETAFYVPKFLAVLHILDNPKAHGFTLPPVEEEPRYETVTIDKQAHLKEVAGHLCTSYEDMKAMNPELRRYSTPNRAYALKVPEGKGAALLAEMHRIPVWHPPVPAYSKHRVGKGETLSTLARRYGTTVRRIMALNGLERSNYIKVGWKLKIPATASYASPTAAVKAAPPEPVKDPPVEYQVRKGDSLWKIARRFGTTTQAIQELNRLAGTHLSIGQRLRISGASTGPSDTKSASYMVQKGDSPYLIAQRYQMNLSEFLRLNRLTPRSTIFPGQTLLVRAE